MKKIMFIALVSMFTYTSVNAENEELNDTAANESITLDEVVIANEEAEQTTDAKPIENELMLQYPNLQASSTEANQAPGTYNEGFKQTKEWKNGRTLRNIGMATTLASIVAMPIACAITKNNFHKTGSEGEEIAYALFDFAIASKGVSYCLAPLAAGIVMWVVGGNKMKKARLSYTRNGFAYNF